MTTIERVDRRIRVILCVCIGALLAPPLAWAGIEPTPFRTGLFGIATGQAIRVSVLNAGGEGGVINSCINPGALVAAVLIRDLRGATIFKSRTEPVEGGAGTFVDAVPVPDAKDPTTGAGTPGGVPPPTPPRRLQLRAEVFIVAEDAVRLRCGDVVLTLEVFDVTTGRTAFTMPFSEVMFNPQPEPPEPIAVP